MLLKITKKITHENAFEQNERNWVKFNPGLSADQPLNNCALSKNKSRHGWTNSRTETDCSIVVFEYWLA